MKNSILGTVESIISSTSNTTEKMKQLDALGTIERVRTAKEAREARENFLRSIKAKQTKLKASLHSKDAKEPRKLAHKLSSYTGHSVECAAIIERAYMLRKIKLSNKEKQQIRFAHNKSVSKFFERFNAIDANNFASKMRFLITQMAKDISNPQRLASNDCKIESAQVRLITAKSATIFFTQSRK